MHADPKLKSKDISLEENIISPNVVEISNFSELPVFLEPEKLIVWSPQTAADWRTFDYSKCLGSKLIVDRLREKSYLGTFEIEILNPEKHNKINAQTLYQQSLKEDKFVVEVGQWRVDFTSNKHVISEYIYGYDNNSIDGAAMEYALNKILESQNEIPTKLIFYHTHRPVVGPNFPSKSDYDFLTTIAINLYYRFKINANDLDLMGHVITKGEGDKLEIYRFRHNLGILEYMINNV